MGADEDQSVLVEPLREIYDSQSGLAYRLLASVGVLVLGLVGVARGISSGGALGELIFGCAFLASGSFMLWSLMIRAFTTKSPVIAMDTTGIFDRRIAPQFIRWSDVVTVQPLRHRGRILGVLLAMDAATLNKLSLSRGQWVVSSLRRWLMSERGVVVSSSGTQVDGEQLYNWCLAYSRSHKFEVDR